MTEPQEPTPTLASPLTLFLEEEQHGDRQAEDVLLLTYTSDLGFFETFGLGAAQACGARVTVVADARMGQPDPRAARRAGRTYLPGLAICRQGGVFHPKLIVIAGPERVTAAIGSGNATLAGWQANAELWTVLRGDESSCPAAFSVMAGWLRQLPSLVGISRGVAEAFDRVAGQLDALVERTQKITHDVYLVSTSEGPILDQLPTGPVDELAVCAPFHDPGAQTLRALVARLQPRLLRISYQPELTELDGPAVAALVAELDAELRYDAEPRYRHGKLIEWGIGGTRYALTGSPNLSGAALRHSLQEGGNCELGVVAPVSTSLLPEGSVVPATALHTKRFEIRKQTHSGPLLLGATRVEHGLHILCARKLTAAGYLELSLAASPPETWERAGEIAAGATEVTLTVAADGGSRVRLMTTAEDGTPRYSNLVFVVDPVRVTRRPGITTTQSSTGPEARRLFDDPRLAEKFFADLDTLRSNQSLRQPHPAAAGGRNDAASAHKADHIDSWEDYLDECAGRVGYPLLRFALGIPAIPAAAGRAFEASVPVSWADEMVSDKETGLQSDRIEDAADQDDDPAAPPTSLPDLTMAPPEVRRRYQRWAEKLTDAASRLPTPERMLVIRLLLWTTAAGAWDHDDRTWIGLLSQALQTLASAELPAEAEPQVGSLAAVALSVLRAEVPGYAHTAETVAFDNAARAVAHLVVATDPNYLTEYVQLLSPAFGGAVNPETVEAVAADVVQNDPIHDAVRTLTARNRDVHQHDDRLLHVIRAVGGNPMHAALEAVGDAQDAGLVGAWANSTNGTWALCIWRRPDLFTMDRPKQQVRWRHYRLSNLLSPSSLAYQRSFDGATPVWHGPFIRPFPEAEAVLAQLGLASPEPPSGCT